MEKTVKKWGVAAILFLWLGLTVAAWLKPSGDIDESERRKLVQFPALSVSTLLNGSFTSGFEGYATDQFPLRQLFRGVKSRFHRNVLGQLDNNDIYVINGCAAKIEYPLDRSSLSHISQHIRNVIGKYIKETDCRVLLSIVPDKGYYLASQHGYPALDYSEMVSNVQNAYDFDAYVDLFDTVALESYYRSDTHWRQEKLLKAADALCKALEIPLASGQDYREESMGIPFYGVYRGQAALQLPPEDIVTLRNAVLDGCKVYNYETNRYAAVYDESKKTSRDPYDIYLSGAAALLRIENPSQDNGRELVVFRDSFGSSIIPLLVHGYETVTVVDTRYLSPDILGQFVEFSDQDVLFLYSTTVINNSSALK